MKMDNTFIARGGLLRCCAYSLLQLADDAPQLDWPIGAIVKCRSGRSSHQMMLRPNKAWVYTDPNLVEQEEREELRSKGGLIDHVGGRTLG